MSPDRELVLTRLRYIATVRHWTVEGREAHEKMGFHEGWGLCADLRTELVGRI